MTRNDSRYSVELDVNAGRGTPRGRPLEVRQFRLVVIGDFRGAGRPSDAPPLASRHPVPVDRDVIDPVLATMTPRARIPLPNGRDISVGIDELEDFHPDRLYARLPVLAPFRELREELSDPARFSRLASRPAAQGPAAPPRPAPSDLLEQIVGEATAAPEDLPGFIQRAVAPHLVPQMSPQQGAMREQVDAAIAALLRLVLHDPAFQALESVWRSLSWLVRQVETSAVLQIHVMDVARAELDSDLRASGPIEATALHQALRAKTAGAPDGEQWSLLVGAYVFGDRSGDIPLLARIAEVAHAIGAPWISGAHPQLVGCQAAEQLGDPRAWAGPEPALRTLLRRGEHARWLGLALPRVLLRVPYGRDGEAPERLPGFEELTEPADHEEYLWGNPAMACGLLLAQAFEAAGGDAPPGMPRDLTGLPFHLRRREGGTEAVPCAETWLTEAGAERLLDEGLIPLASVKDQDAVRLLRVQSVADPQAPLAGLWQGGAG